MINKFKNLCMEENKEKEDRRKKKPKYIFDIALKAFYIKFGSECDPLSISTITEPPSMKRQDLSLPQTFMHVL